MITLKDLTGNLCERSIVLGDHAFSPRDLNKLAEAGNEALRNFIGDSIENLSKGNAFMKELMPSPEEAMKNLKVKVGKPVPPPRPASGFDMPTARQGGLFGGAASLGVSSVIALADGKLTRDEALQIGRDTAIGAGTGALAAAGERVLTPRVDRAVGQTIQNSATRVASGLGQSAAASSTTGAVTRTVATRALGSTAVGAVLATGISAYENREGLARGDSKAIGNVTADTAVAAGSIAAAAATGAAVGSVVPVAGTLIGGAVGLAVGVGVAYGAQLSGARDWLADKAAKAVDWVKSWF